jgi:predicted enzyme related to lactoylglutathione lyase
MAAGLQSRRLFARETSNRIGAKRWRIGGVRPNVQAMPRSSLSFIEFPADDSERARRFWEQLLGVELEARKDSEGEGWQTHSGAPAVGVHARGRGPGDSFSLPYFAVIDVPAALERVEALGGSVVHPGERWAICKDSEGSPFGLTAESL